ncbi:TolC family protein [Terriglobus aquaticus]|uniref:TolC family protein n=1 Tax=Terriglobus aquaticus TaxID=940139 RepID=A0ABW9KNP6_9BACT|nr:TolC family protein [Terriglobus aquaticus]
MRTKAIAYQFALAAVVLLPLSAVAQMHMPMPDSPEHAKPSPAVASPVPGASSARKRSQAPRREAVPEMPFGRLADGDTSTATRPVPAVPMPSGSQGEGGGAKGDSGFSERPMPDLLADAKARDRRPLQWFTDQAARNNPTLREAEAQVRRLRAEAKQAALWQNPEIGYEADHVRGGSYAGGEQGGYVQQTIPLAGQRSSARAAIDAQARAAEIVSAGQARRVESAVQQAFYAALAAEREVELREQVAELAADNAVALHQYANVGQADAPDVLGSEIEREQAQLELAAAQRSYRKAFALLAAVSGDANLPVSLLEGDLEGVPVLPDDSAQSAAAGSPMLQAAQQQAVARAAAIRSERAQAWPQLTLKAGLQQDNEPLDPSLRRVGVVGIAQAGITLPLWNRNQGAVAAAAARQSVAQAEVARAQLMLRMQAEQAVQDYANAMTQAQRYREDLLPRAQRSVELYDAKYAAMAAAYPQRVAAHRMVLQLQLEYTQQLAAAWRSAVVLQHGLLQDGLSAPGTMPSEANSAPDR